MFDCNNYECLNGKVFCMVACLYTGQLGKSIWQIVFINMPTSATAGANKEMKRILQARNPEVKRSSYKQGAYQSIQQGREQLRYKKQRSSFARFHGKYSTVMQTGYRSSMLAWANWQFCSFGCLVPYFFIYKIPLTSGNKWDCFVTHCYILEIEVIFMPSIIAFFVALQKN